MPASDRVTQIAVIIPFFQREAGILERALRSVAAQRLPPGIALTVIVVDDGSPISPGPEIEAVPLRAADQLILVEQRNGGPGDARNRALDMVDPDVVSFVAFLDSDDEWGETHLAEALAALGEAHDFYFCDHTRFNIAHSWFEEREATRRWRAEGAGLTPLHDIENCFRVAPRLMFDASLTEYLSQTSTVVFRATPQNLHRFDPDLRGAGEDQLFWVMLSRSARSIVISYNRNAHCGAGVNIYYSAFDWKKPETTDRYGYLLLFLAKLRRRFPEECRQSPAFAALFERRKKAYGFLFMRSLFRARRAKFRLFARLWKIDPGVSLALPFYSVPVLAGERRNALLWA
jgi:succinoglycan biosynthesis protein ExoW